MPKYELVFFFFFFVKTVSLWSPGHPGTLFKSLMESMCPAHSYTPYIIRWMNRPVWFTQCEWAETLNCMKSSLLPKVTLELSYEQNGCHPERGPVEVTRYKEGWSQFQKGDRRCVQTLLQLSDLGTVVLEDRLICLAEMRKGRQNVPPRKP